MSEGILVGDWVDQPGPGRGELCQTCRWQIREGTEDLKYPCEVVATPPDGPFHFRNEDGTEQCDSYGPEED